MFARAESSGRGRILMDEARFIIPSPLVEDFEDFMTKERLLFDA